MPKHRTTEAEATPEKEPPAKVVQFKSRNQNHLVALPGGILLSFVNGLFETDNPVYIDALRAVVAAEKRGNRGVIEVSGDAGRRVSGVIRLELDGYPSLTLLVAGWNLAEINDKIQEYLDMPTSQNAYAHDKPYNVAEFQQ